MTAANSTDFQAYLESIYSDEKYRGWQDFYTPTDALHRQRIEKRQPARRLNLSLMVQTIVPPRETEAPGQEKEKVERLEVLAGLRKYADNHLLLVGKPGSGKSTALERLLWEEAEAYLSQQNKTPPPNPLPVDREGGQNGEGGQKIPVLVELRRYKTSVLGIIGDFLFQHRCRLNEAEIEQLLFAGRFLLLVDGWNELPDDKARGDVKIFREKYQRFTPMIFTTRELAGDIGIEKKLEMQPLTEAQMRQFVLTYSEKGERLLQQLQGRLRELGKTPLLLWMLCELFDSTGNIPPNLGLVFRCFAQSYDSQIKQDVSTDESRSRWFLLLQHLAFEMMWGKTAIDLRLTIPKQEAEDILTRFLDTKKFDKPRECAFNWLNDLLKYHLIQLTNSNREIEFHHQLLQEYYAAERLLLQLPKLSDDTLKRDYLNYLKWTEPLALMLALMEDEEQALRVVKLALEVDLQLGARLAGEVKPEFQEKIVDLVSKLEIAPNWKVEVLNFIHSLNAISELDITFNNEDYELPNQEIETLENHSNEQALPTLINALNDENWTVRLTVASELGRIANKQAVPALIQALNDEYFLVRNRAAEALGNIGDEQAVPALIQTLNDEELSVRESAASALGKIGNEQAVSALIQALNDEYFSVRESAAEALGNISDKQAVPALIQTLNDEELSVRKSAASALGKIGNEQAVSALIQCLNCQDHIAFRRVVASALGKIGNEQAVFALIYLLKDEDFVLRRIAAKSLGKIGNEQAVDPLIQALNNENEWFVIREYVAEALVKIGNKQVFPALVMALNNKEYSIRSVAARMLGKIGNEQAIPALVLTLNDEESSVRCSAVEALVKISNSQAVYPLVLALNDEYFSVRESAAQGLGNIGSPKLLPLLVTYIETEISFVALDAISNIQNRCKYYNYEIYTSPAPKQQKPENPIIDTLNTLNQTLQTMSETPTNDFRGASFSNLGSVTGNIQGDVNNIGTQHNYAPKQNLAESAAEIQQLLEQLAKNNQTIVQSDNQAVVVSAIHEEIKRNPTIKARLWSALKAGGTEALKVALDAIFKNPVVSIPVETIKGFIEAE